MHFELSKLMVYEPNYPLLSKNRRNRGTVLYIMMSRSICRCFVGQYLLETSPRVYSQGWYALDGRNRPSTARDMLTSVNGCPRWPIHAHCCTMAKVDPLHRPMRQYHIIPSKNTYQRAMRHEDLSGALKLMSTFRPGQTAKNAN